MSFKLQKVSFELQNVSSKFIKVSFELKMGVLNREK